MKGVLLRLFLVTSTILRRASAKLIHIKAHVNEHKFTVALDPEIDDIALVTLEASLEHKLSADDHNALRQFIVQSAQNIISEGLPQEKQWPWVSTIYATNEDKVYEVDLLATDDINLVAHTLVSSLGISDSARVAELIEEVKNKAADDIKTGSSAHERLMRARRKQTEIESLKTGPEPPPYRPEAALERDDIGWDGSPDSGWPTPFHTFISYYADAAAPGILTWENYFIPRHKHLERYRGKELTLVEVGVFSGGSMLLWRWYFGPGLRYIGIDINPLCKQFDGLPWAEIVTGNVEDPQFWEDFKQKYPNPDIFVDDGGHTMYQQKSTFIAMYPHVKADGIFMIEDLHTNYYAQDYGGNPNPDIPLDAEHATFLEYSYRLIHWLHGHRFFASSCVGCEAYREKHFAQMADFCRSVNSISYYESLMVVEKGTRMRKAPIDINSGTYFIPWIAPSDWKPVEYNWRNFKHGYLFPDGVF